MRDNTWKEEVHQMVDEGVSDLVELGLRAKAIHGELVSQGHSPRRAKALIEAEVQKYSRNSFRVR